MSLQELKQRNVDLTTLQWLAGDVSVPSMPSWVAFSPEARADFQSV